MAGCVKLQLPASSSRVCHNGERVPVTILLTVSIWFIVIILRPETYTSEKQYVYGDWWFHINYMYFVICCGARTSLEQRSRDVPAPDNKSLRCKRCCCHNSRLTVINPNYNMTKQHCIKYIYNKIHSKSPPNRPICLHCDVMHLYLMTGVAALHISSAYCDVGTICAHNTATRLMWHQCKGQSIVWFYMLPKMTHYCLAQFLQMATGVVTDLGYEMWLRD